MSPRLPGPVASIIRRISLYSYVIYRCHIPPLFWSNALFERMLGGLAGKLIAEPFALSAIFAVAALVPHFF